MYELLEAISNISTSLQKRGKEKDMTDDLKPKSYIEWKLNNERYNPEKTSCTLQLNSINQIQNTVYGKMLKSISTLDNDWDGYGAVAPSKIILEKTIAFIQNLPTYISNELSEEDIYPNPNGTITVEWRNNDNSVSVELGITTSNYLTRINAEYSGEENLQFIDKSIPSNLIDDIKKVID